MCPGLASGRLPGRLPGREPGRVTDIGLFWSPGLKSGFEPEGLSPGLVEGFVDGLETCPEGLVAGLVTVVLGFLSAETPVDGRLDVPEGLFWFEEGLT